nr:hypothetical protein MedDCM-OCT-S15-C1-cds9 [uncultured Mediterranean phage MEDS1 group]BAR39034.1 hypothetical protein [uncultured Mediterranean phage uvMED]
MTQKYLVGQRFEVGDRVTRKTIFSGTEDFIKRYGIVKEVLLKENRKGTSTYYYQILWNDSKSSEHAQHTLVKAIY